LKKAEKKAERERGREAGKRREEKERRREGEKQECRDFFYMLGRQSYARMEGRLSLRFPIRECS